MAATASAHPPADLTSEQDVLVRVRPPAGAVGDADALDAGVTWLRAHEFDVGGVARAESTIGVYTNLSRLPQLTKSRFAIVDQEPLTPLNYAEMRALSDFYDQDEVQAILETTAADHPEITRLFQVGTSYEDRPIWGIEISDHPGQAEDEPAIQFNGCHHSREVTTPHIVLDIIEFLTDGYATADPQAVEWVRGYKTVCVPMVNPDGSRHVFNVNSGWRKNRRDNGDGTRGVDLNRNYPYHWGSGTNACERGSGSSGSTFTDTYRGESPASEPETQAMIALAQDWDFVIAVSYHSYGQFIDYPYACNDGIPDNSMPEDEAIDAMMHGIGDGIAAVDDVQYEVYSPIAESPVNGDDTSWYYAHLGTYAFIIETGVTNVPSYSQLPEILAREAGGWRYLLTRLGQSRLDVYATSACNGDPIRAQVGLDDYDYDTGERPRFTSLPYGRKSFMVMPNRSFQVSLAAVGYSSKTVSVEVGSQPVRLDVMLEPDPMPVDLLGDMNLDGEVNGDDIQAFADAIIDGGSADPGVVARGDFNSDCRVGDTDLEEFLGLLLSESR